MNHALDQLQRTLHNINRVALARMRLGDSLQIAQERSKLIDWLGDTTELEESPGSAVDALRALHRTSIFQIAPGEPICYGCSHSARRPNI